MATMVYSGKPMLEKKLRFNIIYKNEMAKMVYSGTKTHARKKPNDLI